MGFEFQSVVSAPVCFLLPIAYWDLCISRMKESLYRQYVKLRVFDLEPWPPYPHQKFSVMICGHVL